MGAVLDELLRGVCRELGLPDPIQAAALPSSGRSFAAQIHWEQGLPGVLEVVPPHPFRSAVNAALAARLASRGGVRVNPSRPVQVKELGGGGNLWTGLGGITGAVQMRGDPASGPVVARAVGAQLGAMRAVRLPDFGRLSPRGVLREHADWPAMVLDRAEIFVAMAPQLGALGDRLVERVRGAREVLEQVTTWGLVHGALTPAVVHLDGAHAVGLRGWEGAFAGDPAWDLSPLAHLASPALSAVLQGVGPELSGELADPAFRERVEVYHCVGVLEQLVDVVGLAEPHRWPRLESIRCMAERAAQPGLLEEALRGESAGAVFSVPGPHAQLLRLFDRLGHAPVLGPEHIGAWCGAVAALLLASTTPPGWSAPLMAWSAHLFSSLPQPTLEIAGTRTVQEVMTTASRAEPRPAHSGMALAGLAAVAAARLGGAVPARSWAGLQRLVVMADSREAPTNSPVLKAAIRAPVAIAGALGAARVTPGMRVSLKAYADQMAVALVRETHGAAPLRLQAEEATRHGLQQMIEPLLVASPSIRAAWVPAMVYASVQLAELGQRLVPAARLATLALRPESDFAG